MTASHNIDGCEATDQHPLIAFGHAYGSIVELPRSRGRTGAFLVLAAGCALAAIATLLILTRR